MLDAEMSQIELLLANTKETEETWTSIEDALKKATKLTREGAYKLDNFLPRMKGLYIPLENSVKVVFLIEDFN